MVALPLVIAPVLRSKLSAKDTTPVRIEDMPDMLIVPRENGNVTSTVSALTSCLNTMFPSLPAVYLASLDEPMPDTLDRSKIRMTAGGWLNLLGSSTSWLETCA